MTESQCKYRAEHYWVRHHFARNRPFYRINAQYWTLLNDNYLNFKVPAISLSKQIDLPVLLRYSENSRLLQKVKNNPPQNGKLKVPKLNTPKSNTPGVFFGGLGNLHPQLGPAKCVGFPLAQCSRNCFLIQFQSRSSILENPKQKKLSFRQNTPLHTYNLWDEFKRLQLCPRVTFWVNIYYCPSK